MIFLQEAIWDKQAKHSALVAEGIYLRLSKILHHHQSNYMQISLSLFILACLNSKNDRRAIQAL